MRWTARSWARSSFLVGVALAFVSGTTPLRAQGHWDLCPQSEWTDEFSPLWVYVDPEGEPDPPGEEAVEVYCEGDPSLPDEAAPGEQALLDRRWEDSATHEICACRYVANVATVRFLPAASATFIRDVFTSLGLEVKNAW